MLRREGRRLSYFYSIFAYLKVKYTFTAFTFTFTFIYPPGWCVKGPSFHLSQVANLTSGQGEKNKCAIEDKSPATASANYPRLARLWPNVHH